jgi:hypothetical protein
MDRVVITEGDPGIIDIIRRDEGDRTEGREGTRTGKGV